MTRPWAWVQSCWRMRPDLSSETVSRDAVTIVAAGGLLAPAVRLVVLTEHFPGNVRQSRPGGATFNLLFTSQLAIGWKVLPLQG